MASLGGLSPIVHLWTAAIRDRRSGLAGVDDHRGGDRKKITVYGDGKQVRDVLHVEDLLNAYDAAIENIDTAKGQVYNMGGGTRNVMAIWAEFGPILEKLLGKKIEVARDDWRPGDQKVFYADFRKAETRTRLGTKN